MPDPIQLDLFADAVSPAADSHATPSGRIDPSTLSDSRLISAIPDASFSEACELAAEAGRRRLGGAVPALAALCSRFTGFGVDRAVPEPVAALQALAEIGGAEAARFVGEAMSREIVLGPTLAVAAAAAERLGVVFSNDFALRLLRHPDPAVRAAACSCVRAGAEVVAALLGLLLDRDVDVSTAAACALGRMGRAEAREPVKRLLRERPSPRAIEAAAGVVDEDIVVLLARLGRARPEYSAAVLAALDEVESERASGAADGLRRWLAAREGR